MPCGPQAKPIALMEGSVEAMSGFPPWMGEIASAEKGFRQCDVISKSRYVRLRAGLCATSACVAGRFLDRVLTVAIYSSLTLPGSISPFRGGDGLM